MRFSRVYIWDSRSRADQQFFQRGEGVEFRILTIVIKQEKNVVNITFFNKRFLYVLTFNQFLEQAVRRAQLFCCTFVQFFWSKYQCPIQPLDKYSSETIKSLSLPIVERKYVFVRR